MLEHGWISGGLCRTALVMLVMLVMLGSCDDSGPPGTFTEIYETLFPPTTAARCNFCHSMPATDISNGNLSTGVDQDSAYAALVGKTSTSSRCSGKTLVVPHNPGASLVLDKFSAKPTCGDRMPLGGMMLSDAEVELIRSWIAAGANND